MAPNVDENKLNDLQVKEKHDEIQHEDDHDHPVLKFSFKQMWLDTLNLDWSLVLWDMVFAMVLGHVLSFYGFYLAVFTPCKWQSFVFTVFLAYAGGIGITMGTHRLWTHKAFEAKPIVRFFLMIMNSISFQESIYLWCQNHRVHHKWSDTDRDFTNSRRGFFFAHMGWKMYKTHPEVIVGRKLVNCDDLLADVFVKFQHDYYYYISLPLCFILPTVIPYYFWNEDLVLAFAMCACMRVAITFHSTWCINSFAHMYGYRPYDKNLLAYEHSFLGPWALGEGWHNYHHAFPRDYRASELHGWGVNVTTKLIETLASVGLVYNLRTETDDHIEKRTRRTGDDSIRFKTKW